MIQQNFRRLANLLSVLIALAFFNIAVSAQISFSDTKPGSVLFFNRYTSNPNNPQQGDTQINMTNTNPTEAATVHLFFVDGASCSVADFTVFLTPSQTISFLASDYDPGIQGYMVAVATDGSVPTQFNWLIGSAFIRENDGRQATLPAIAVPKLSPGTIDPTLEGNYSLIFNGTEYDRLPNALATTSFNSEMIDSNNLIVYSPVSDLTTGSIGGSTGTVNISTLIYDDQVNPISSSFSVRCCRVDSFTSLFNRGGAINRHVPAGRSGWIRLSSTNRPLLGSVISRGPVFSGGYNLPALSSLPSFEMKIPVF